MKRLLSTIVLVITAITVLSAEESFTMGERLFKSNKPAEAITYLQKAITESPINPAVYNYLGLSYYQLGQLQNSLDAFLQGTSVSGTNKKLLFFNAGNTAFALNNYTQAIELYSMSLAADPSYASAMLNRANSKLKMDNLTDAVTDYTQYLGLAPDSSQRTQIEALIAMLQVETENRKVEAEQLAIQEQRIEQEQQRIAEEKAIADAEAEKQRLEAEQLAAQVAAEAAEKENQRKAAEAERRKKLLEEVAASLQDASSTNITAGSEGIMEYEQESELD